MADDQLATRTDSPRGPYLWTRIFNTFRVALDPKKLLLAAAGIVIMAAGWWLLAVLFYNSRSAPTQADYPIDQYVSSVPKDDKSERQIRQEAEQLRDKDLQQAQRRYQLLEATAGPGGRLRTWPWVQDRGPNPVLLTESALTGRLATAPHAPAENLYAQFLYLIEPLVKFLEPVCYLFHPDAGLWNRIYFLLVILWTLLVWAFFGGAIARMAAVQFARNDKIGMTEALRFARSRYASFLFAPLFPLILIAFLTLLLIIYGLFGVLTVFFGDIILYGLGWPVAILFGLVMALTLVGLIGWPLMYATIGTEGSDSFDALSRSYSYVYQAPWRYLWYAFWAVVYGAVVVFFVGFMGSLTVYLGKWAVSQAPFARALDRDPAYLFVWAPTSFQWRDLLLEGSPAVYTHEDVDAVNRRLTPADRAAIADKKTVRGIDPAIQEDIRENNFKPGAIRTSYWRTFHFWNYVGAALVAFWVGLIFLLVLGFGYSYFWSAGTIIYLLMRRHVDDTEIDEVHLEEDELEESYAPPAEAPAKEPPPAGTPNLIPPESLTLRPAAPTAPEPPPATATPAPEPPPAEPAPTTTQVVTPTPPAEAPRPTPPPGGDGNPPPTV